MVTGLVTVFDTKMGMPLRPFSLKVEDNLIGRYPYTGPNVHYGPAPKGRSRGCELSMQHTVPAAQPVSMHGLKKIVQLC